MKKLLCLFMLVLLSYTHVFAQAKPAPQDKKKLRYKSTIGVLFGYEMSATKYDKSLITNNFSKIPQPTPSIGIDVTGRIAPALGFMMQFYHSYYPFEHDYNNYSDPRTIYQYSMYLGPELRIGAPKFMFEAAAMAGFSLLENKEFTLSGNAGYVDVQPNDQVAVTFKGLADFRIAIHKHFAIKIGVAYTYAHYDVKVDNSLPTFYNDRITPFIGLMELSK